MSRGSRPGTLSRAARTICAVRSSGRTVVIEPLKARPIGERAVETITASGIRVTPCEGFRSSPAGFRAARSAPHRCLGPSVVPKLPLGNAGCGAIHAPSSHSPTPYVRAPEWTPEELRGSGHGCTHGDAAGPPLHLGD